VALQDLLLTDAADPAAWMSPKPVQGVCRLCGQLRNLTFEHIPIEAAGNGRRARAISMEKLVERDEPFTFPNSGWRQAQRGAGGHVLCKDCNEFVGGEYGGAYARFATWLECGLEQLNGRMPRDGMLLRHDEHQLGDIARAALVSLIALSVGHAVVDRDPHLLDMIKHAEPGLPEGLRLGLTIVAGNRIRHSPPSAMCGPAGWTVFMEVAAQPMAWTLSYVDDELVMPERSVNVSSWLDIPHRRRASLDLLVPTGIVFNSAPIDYRSELELRGNPEG